MTISTYFLKWRGRRASYGQHPNHLKKDNMLKKKVNEDEDKHRENVGKGRSIKK
jgi:hypothetical protein